MSAKIEKFEDLMIWQEGIQISISIYQLFQNCTDYGFKDQIRRSAVSIPSNIAEGYDRQTNKEFIQFLYIARGSCSELRTQIYLAKEIGYISEIQSCELIEQTKKYQLCLQNILQSEKKNFKHV